jgi:ubiquinone/menaquinone biosynthesis C-methylase UbiE
MPNSLRDQDRGEIFRPGGLDLTRETLAYCQFPPRARIVDVGCGSGATVQFLTADCNLDAIGFDASEAVIERGKQRYRDLPIFAGSGERLPVQDGFVDGVFMECVLSLMSVDLALAEAYRVLGAGGRLIVSDVYFRNAPQHQQAPLPNCSCLPSASTKEVMLTKLSEHGFTTVFWQDRSELIKALLFETIMRYGSAKEFWNCLLPGTDLSCAMREQVKRWRLGYYLLIAARDPGPL